MIFLGDVAGLLVVFRNGRVLVAQIHLDDLLHVLIEVGQALLDLAARLEEVRVTVVGAHLTGQPLNKQLTERGARLLKSCKTAKDYRLYALANTTPPKPGLVREPGFQGPGIEVEVWGMPAQNLGSFLALIPAPLGLGTLTLDDGTTATGFICEPAGLAGAKEITELGGWRAYLASR